MKRFRQSAKDGISPEPILSCCLQIEKGFDMAPQSADGAALNSHDREVVVIAAPKERRGPQGRH